jgi:tetratricopeptide (TPR) repeat protein
MAKQTFLEPMVWEAQKWNNCGPVSAMMVMSYYGINKTQDQCAAAIKGAEGDKKVRPDEIIGLLGQNGLKAFVVENGNFDLLRTFLSNNIPVITQSYFKLDEDIAHYRVMRGYDQAKGYLYVNDSMEQKGGTTVDYALEEKMWKAFNHRFMPVYKAKDEALVKAILGADADQQANYTRALATTESFLDKNPKDLDGLRNAGYMRYATANYKGALEIWDRIVKLGPVGRFVWYQMWPLESYNKVGRYQDALKLADETLSTAPVYTEARYERAVALLALNRKDEAVKELKHSLLDGYYQPTRDLLDKLSA